MGRGNQRSDIRGKDSLGEGSGGVLFIYLFILENRFVYKGCMIQCRLFSNNALFYKRLLILQKDTWRSITKVPPCLAGSGVSDKH